MNRIELARRLAPMLSLVGAPSKGANDTDAVGLALAHANLQWLRKQWCTCTNTESVYWADLNTGKHGWMCTRCHGITQIG